MWGEEGHEVGKNSKNGEKWIFLPKIICFSIFVKKEGKKILRTKMPEFVDFKRIKGGLKGIKTIPNNFKIANV